MMGLEKRYDRSAAEITAGEKRKAAAECVCSCQRKQHKVVFIKPSY